MDCEKFETLLIDELYGELDEVTSAAARRHAAGCARCGALLSGLRATRKVAALPVEEPSSDLEDRILSAVREQQKVLPFRARAAMALSRAGAWAMRPQTAMAAVFLVVIGTSFVLVQSRKSSTPAAEAKAEGAPVASAVSFAAASAYALDGRESALAHGVEDKDLPRAPVATASAAPGLGLTEFDDQALAKKTAPRGAELALGGAMGGGAPTPQSGGDAPGAAEKAETSAANARQAESGDGEPGFARGRAAYDARRYDAARSQWDQLAPTDPRAALWAGRAEKAKNGCTAAAVARFESARAHAPAGSSVANDATLEAARCYRAMNDSERARARYAALAGQPGYAAMAQNELDEMSPATARAAPVRAHRAPAATSPAAAPPAQSQTKAGN